jgi:imidazolonepropionase-like amidohydrolase
MALAAGPEAGAEARQMVACARKHGIQSTVHTGGSSVPGSGYIDADTVREADADIIGHINGGQDCHCARFAVCARGVGVGSK